MASSKSGIETVVVHPTVLLSVVDHYNRLAKNTKKRVVGVLLGETFQGRVDITNCYAVPFDEDEKKSNIWFLDHDYHETMYGMLRRVNANERVVGWYSSGPKMRPSDLDIHRLIMRYAATPVFVIVDVNPKDSGIPTEAYIAKESIQNEGEEPQLAFQHIPSEIGALEVEEIGVEHLLRDVKDTNISTLTTQVQNKLASLGGLIGKLQQIHTYLQNVCEERLPVNYHIMYQLQNVLNFLPNLNTADVHKALYAKTNDMMLVVYMSAVVRAIIALHMLINNKLSLKDRERKETTDAAAPATTGTPSATAAAADGAGASASADKGKDSGSDAKGGSSK